MPPPPIEFDHNFQSVPSGDGRDDRIGSYGHTQRNPYLAFAQCLVNVMSSIHDLIEIDTITVK